MNSFTPSSSGPIGALALTSTFDETASGGGVGSGSALVSHVVSIAGEGGGLGGGTSAPHMVFNPITSGGGKGSGTWKGRYDYVADGGITVGGEASTAVLGYVFEQKFEWNDIALLRFSKSFKWDDGPQPMKWYRVIGCCRFPTAAGSGTIDGEPIQPVQPGGCDVLPIQTEDEKCQGALGKNSFVQNIAAHNLEEVCQNLKDNKFAWPVCSIAVFSRPADNRFVDPNDNCNTLTEVPYCEIPACLDFCLHTDGIVSMGMTATVNMVNLDYFEYIGSGGITVGGRADTYTDGDTGDLEGEASGGALGSGSAIVEFINDTGYETDMGMTATIEDLEVFFSEIDNNTVELTQDDGTISTKCQGCSDLPMQLLLTHNLDDGAVLVDFLNRNGETLPTILTLNYSRRLGSWQSQLHYKGVSDNRGTEESWRILFEWACVDSIASQDLGSFVWKFSMSVLRKNLLTGMDFDTRLLVTFPPGQICANADILGLDFEFSYNTQRGTVTTDTGVVPDVVLLYDNIGMFKSQQWVNNPDFELRIAQTVPGTGFTTQDISPIFPESTIFQGQ